jgi:hypothetical protein
VKGVVFVDRDPRGVATVWIGEVGRPRGYGVGKLSIQLVWSPFSIYSIYQNLPILGEFQD